MKMYIAVLDEVPDSMVPTLVAHSVINAHILYSSKEQGGAPTFEAYDDWLKNSFKKVTLRVNRKEFAKISELECWLGHENTTLNGEKSCAVVLPMLDENRPNVLKFAKMWKPKDA